MTPTISKSFLALALAGLAVAGFLGDSTRAETVAVPAVASPEAPAADGYLDLPFPAADGFALPAGPRWKVGTLPGPEVRFARRGRRPACAAVFALARGRVAESDAPGTVAVEHVFFENHLRRAARATLSGLERVSATAGALVERGEVLGCARDAFSLRLEVEGEQVDTLEFVAERGSLPVPLLEPRWALIEVEARRMRLFEQGQLVSEWEVAFGQSDGTKRVRGDLKTPRGMYFVVDRRKGEFPGPTGPYFGGHWVKLNYPNRYDARRGLEAKLLTAAQARRIGEDWEARRLTDQKTKLGGGIGLHGWAWEWTGKEDGFALSWGCVVMHLADVAKLYERATPGMMVVIR